jgi:hypothetical protein
MKKKMPRGDTVASFAAALEENCPQTVCGLDSALGQCKDTISRILFEDLGLVKKFARCMSKLLNEDLKKVRMDKVNCSYGPQDWVSWKELLPSMKTEPFLTPESNLQSKQWVKRGEPSPVPCLLRKKQCPWSS